MSRIALAALHLPGFGIGLIARISDLQTLALLGIVVAAVMMARGHGAR